MVLRNFNKIIILPFYFIIKQVCKNFSFSYHRRMHWRRKREKGCQIRLFPIDKSFKNTYIVNCNEYKNVLNQKLA